MQIELHSFLYKESFAVQMSKKIPSLYIDHNSFYIVILLYRKYSTFYVALIIFIGLKVAFYYVTIFFYIILMLELRFYFCNMEN